MNVRLGVAAGLIAVLWGLCFVVIQASLPNPAPLLLAGLRSLIGGAVLAGWILLRRRRPDIVQASASASVSISASPNVAWWRSGLPSVSVLLVLALANAALAFGAMYLAAGRAEAAVASVLAGGQPLVLAAAGWLLFGERASIRTAAGLVVAASGVTLVATTAGGATSADGVGLSILATFAPALGTVLMRRLGTRVDLLVTTSSQFLLGGALLLVASALLEPWGAVRWSPALLSGLVVLGVLGTGVAYVVWFWLLTRLSLVSLGTSLYLIPVTGVVAAILAGDRPAPIELVGIAVVLAGIGLVMPGATTPRDRPGATTLRDWRRRNTPRSHPRGSARGRPRSGADSPGT